MKYLAYPVYALLAVWLLVVGLVAFAPAEWLLYQALNQGILGKNAPQLSWQGMEGTVRQGKLATLRVGNFNLHNLSWQLSIPRLLIANPSLNLQLGSSPQASENWQAKLNIKPWGSLQMQLNGGDLEQIIGSKGFVAAEGVLAGTVSAQAKLTKTGFACQKLAGKLQGPSNILRPLAVNLGNLELKPSCPRPDQLHLDVFAIQPQEHSLDLTAKMNAKNWSFNGQAEVEAQAPLAGILQMLSWRKNAEGVYTGRGAGRF